MLLSAKGFLPNQIFLKEAEDLLIFYKLLPQARTPTHAFVYVAIFRMQAIRHEFYSFSIS
jgi:hypothetical protein